MASVHTEKENKNGFGVDNQLDRKENDMGVYIKDLKLPKDELAIFKDGKYIEWNRGLDFKEYEVIDIDDEWFKKLTDAYVLQQIRYGEGRSEC